MWHKYLHRLTACTAYGLQNEWTSCLPLSLLPFSILYLTYHLHPLSPLVSFSSLPHLPCIPAPPCVCLLCVVLILLAGQALQGSNLITMFIIVYSWLLVIGVWMIGIHKVVVMVYCEYRSVVPYLLSGLQRLLYLQLLVQQTSKSQKINFFL